jgi:tetratricopeptide (TPR) repeat protein
VYEVGTALLVEYFNELPQLGPQDDPAEWKIRLQAANEGFKKRVQARYSEGTLLRLLESSGDTRTRRAAMLALGLLGSMNASMHLAACLHDDDPETRQIAVNALWSLWFRADTPAHNKELQRMVRMKDPEKALAGLSALIDKAPQFAEAYNQRAILLFRKKQYERSIADCVKTLHHNPFHFGAQAGMGQGLLQLRRHKAALKAFRNALKIHPYMEGIADTIRALENALGGEERRDDKK